MKLLLKLNRHIEAIRDVEDGLVILLDSEENEINSSDIPENADYILEIEENTYYLYPRFLSNYKNDFTVIACKYCGLEYILREIKNDENIEILKINEIQKRLYKNRKPKPVHGEGEKILSPG